MIEQKGEKTKKAELSLKHSLDEYMQTRTGKSIDGFGGMNMGMLALFDATSLNDFLGVHWPFVVAVVAVIGLAYLYRIFSRTRESSGEQPERKHKTYLDRQEGQDRIIDLIKNGKQFTFTLVDVNKLGLLNKIYGKAIVNKLLDRMFALINATLALTYVDSFAYRIGGDEVGIVLVNSNEEEIRSTLMMVQQVINEEFANYTVYSIDNASLNKSERATLEVISLAHTVLGGKKLCLFTKEIALMQNAEMNNRMEHYPNENLVSEAGLSKNDGIYWQGVSMGAVDKDEVVANDVYCDITSDRLLIDALSKRAEDALRVAKESRTPEGRVRIGIFPSHMHNDSGILTESERVLFEAASISNMCIDNEQEFRTFMAQRLAMASVDNSEGTLIEVQFAYQSKRFSEYQGRFKACLLYTSPSPRD